MSSNAKVKKKKKVGKRAEIRGEKKCSSTLLVQTALTIMDMCNVRGLSEYVISNNFIQNIRVFH
jgi:hypothetical protein